MENKAKNNLGIIHGGSYSFVVRRAFKEYEKVVLGKSKGESLFNGKYVANFKYFFALYPNREYVIRVESSGKGRDY